MFFGLKPVADHPCTKMQDVVESFFKNSVDQHVFSLDLFPKWIHTTFEHPQSTLSDKFAAVHQHLHTAPLDEDYRRSVYEQFLNSNHIKDLCDGATLLSANVIDWNSELGKSIKSLMDDLYSSLNLVVFRKNKKRRNTKSVPPTKELYSEFIKANKYVCPFCGLDVYKNKKGKRREDFDHYLNKSRYPFSAVNFDNLVPTCGTCNQDYKQSKDVFEGGTAFYPYSDIPEIKVQVDCVKYPPMTDLDDKGEWVVEVELVVPDDAVTPKMSTWDRVFEIKQRLADEVTEFFEEWMEQISEDDQNEVDEQHFRDLLESEKQKAVDSSIRRMEPKQIIRSAFYEFMLERAERTFALSFMKARNSRTQ